MIDARNILSNAIAFRYYLKGAQKQSYVDLLLREYEYGLEDLSPMTAMNWIYYIDNSNKERPVLGKDFMKFKERLIK